jgi:hypothetical protein
VLTTSQLEQFDRDGYLVVEDVIDPLRDLGPVLGDYQQVLSGICEALYVQGHISQLYYGLP